MKTDGCGTFAGCHDEGAHGSHERDFAFSVSTLDFDDELADIDVPCLTARRASFYHNNRDEDLQDCSGDGWRGG